MRCSGRDRAVAARLHRRLEPRAGANAVLEPRGRSLDGGVWWQPIHKGVRDAFERQQRRERVRARVSSSQGTAAAAACLPRVEQLLVVQPVRSEHAQLRHIRTSGLEARTELRLV